MTPAADLASGLCNECGLCCDGTLFSHATPASGESAEILAGIGLTTGTHQDGSLQILQPCVQFHGSCGIYESRPYACRKFRCGLLKSLDRGERDGVATAQIIRETKVMLEVLRLERDDPAPPGAALVPHVPLVNRARNMLAAASAGSAEASRDRSANPVYGTAFRFILYVERYFLPPKSKPSESTTEMPDYAQKDSAPAV